MHPDSDTVLACNTYNTSVKKGHFQRVAKVVQRVAARDSFLSTTLCDVLQQIYFALRVARKTLSTQWCGVGRNSATLYFLKTIRSMYVYVYVHVYRGSIGTALLLLRPPGSVGSAVPS